MMILIRLLLLSRMKLKQPLKYVFMMMMIGIPTTTSLLSFMILLRRESSTATTPNAKSQFWMKIFRVSYSSNVQKLWDQGRIRESTSKSTELMAQMEILAVILEPKH